MLRQKNTARAVTAILNLPITCLQLAGAALRHIAAPAGLWETFAVFNLPGSPLQQRTGRRGFDLSGISDLASQYRKFFKKSNTRRE